MNMKRFVAGMLAVLTIAGAPMTVYAETKTADTKTSDKTAEAKALEAAIKDVKKRVTIPADLDKFEYDSSTKYGVTYFELQWYKEETVKRSWGDDTVVSKRITVDYYKGMITSVSVYDRNRSDRTGFGKLTNAQAEEYAKKHLQKIFPDIKGEPVFERVQSSNALRSSDITYDISRPVSGIEFDKNGGRITIDKDTGALVGYRMTWWNDAVFPDASKRLSVEQVSEIYKSRKPLEAKYRLFSASEFDQETRRYEYKQFILPVYTPTVYGENEIDAITGKYTSIYDDRKKYSYTDAYDWSDTDDDMYEEEACEEAEENVVEEELSEAEIAAVNDESKYLSYEKCLEIIKKDEFIVFNSELVNQSNYLSSYTDIKGETQPLRVLRFKFSSSDEKKDSISLNVNMNALTGEIISFSKDYSYGNKSPNKNKKGADDKAVLKRANEAAKHFMGNKAAEFRADKAPYVYKSKDYTANSGSVHYKRYVNDLCADFDSIDIEVDSRNEVLSFRYTYHDMEFPKPDLVGEDAAYKKLFENMKPSLEYTGFTDLQLKPHTYLTYYFDDNYMLNALTGERIRYDGSLYYVDEPVKEEKVIAYTDIKGHKYEKEIQTLLDYGIYVTDSDKLAPDELITNGEFAQLYDKVCGTRIMDDLYPDTWNGHEYVRNADLDKKLTRAELAKIYVSIYAEEYADAAAVENIYKAPYTDVGSDHPYCGWIVFAKTEGFVKGSGGKFSPNAGMTKADCLKLAYDFLAGDDNDREIYEIVRI